MEPNHTKINKKFSAILFADIVAYSAIMQANERRGLDILRQFKKVLESEVPNHHGRITQFYGDGCLVIFESSRHALTCALTIQQKFIAEPSVPVRMGLHAGDVIIEDGNIYGDTVNITSRIESMGIAGSILCSNAFRDQIGDDEQFAFSRLGRFSFKNIEGNMFVFGLGKTWSRDSCSKKNRV